MADRETNVRFRAVGDFVSFARSVRTARRNVDELKAAQDRLNASTAAGAATNVTAANRSAAAQTGLGEAVDKTGKSARQSTIEFLNNARTLREQAAATERATAAQEDLGQATERAQFSTRRARIEAERLASGQGKATEQTRRQRREIERMQATMGRATQGLALFQRGLNRLQNWRPRLTPPFVVLIPLLAGALGLVNPLVAGIGALAAAGFGLASSFGSAAGALVAGLIPALATAVGLIAALRVGFGGIGSALQAANAVRDAAGSGGGGGGAPQRAAITAAEELARAQEDLARATQDVAFAEEDLDDARSDYVRRLKELQKAVDRAAVSEARAAANSQLARENYANVLADPGSTKGEKMDAQVGVDEARFDQQDVIEQNKQNQEDLLEMQRKGIEGDRQVIAAQRGLTDAINRQRDAQIALLNAQNGSNTAMGGGAGLVDEYQRMLDRLSPSARKFVETIVGLKDRWDELRRSVQESFFGEVVDDLDLIQKYLDPLERMLDSIAKAAGGVFSRLLQRTTTPEWLEDIAAFGDEAAPAISDIGDGLIELLDAFRDIVMASMPFFREMAEGFKEGAANFAIFAEEGRKNGSIAEWLEKGRKNLALWWEIIKNIGVTLFNFGTASEDFSMWLTEGLRDMTESWRESSEEAKKAGSPFRKFLEDIKPLLSEINGMIGDFFSWFGREAADTENLRQMQEVIKTIREDIGPGLATIFDALSKAEIGPKLAEAIGKLVEFVGAVLEGGGAGALSTFFDMVGGLLDALTAFAKTPLGNVVLVTLGSVMAGLAALSFVGQFSGLTGLLGLILQFGKGGGVGILSRIAGLLGIGAAAGGGVALPVGGSGRRSSGTTVVGGNGGTGARGIPGAGAGGAIRGGLAVAGRAALPIAVITTAIGMVENAIGALGEPLSNMEKYQKTAAEKGPLAGIKQLNADVTEGGQFAKATNPAVLLISEFLGIFFPELQVGFDQWLADTSEGFLNWAAEFFLVTMPQFLGDVLENWIAGFEIIKEWWNSGIEVIKTWWRGLITGVTQGFVTFIGTLLGLWVGLVSTVSSIWSGLVTGLRLLWEGAVALFSGNFATAIDKVRQAWEAITTPIRDAFLTFINGLIGWVNGLPLPFDLPFLGTGESKGSAGRAPKGQPANNGGVIRRAMGGGVPGRGNSDTVPAMLTPGEVVIRKEIVNRVGEKNLLDFNRGVLSYQEMLTRAMASGSGNPQKRKGGGGISFFNGGGLVAPTFSGGGSGSGFDPKNFPGPPPAGAAGFVVENLIVNNPAPEPASDSLPRSIRKVSYLGGGR